MMDSRNFRSESSFFSKLVRLIVSPTAGSPTD